MDENRRNKYRQIGLEVFKVAACIAIFVFMLVNINYVQGVLTRFITVLNPVWIGTILCFLVSPLYNNVYKWLTGKKLSKFFSKFLSTIVSMIVVIGVIIGLITMIIPKVYDSLVLLYYQAPDYINNLAEMAFAYSGNEDVEKLLISVYTGSAEYIKNFVDTVIVPNLSTIASTLYTSVKNVFMWVYYALIGLVVMVYLLNIKDDLLPKAKKLIYACFKPHTAQIVCQEIRRTYTVFGGFITGKLLDSLIVGVICFICLTLLKMPFALLVSVIVGITNIIPYLGPFIGAIPSAFIIFMINPGKGLIFILFILILQQIDGNIIGPKILGDSTGVSSFWILFSVILFGGLFGFVGMIIAVPTWALITSLVTRVSENSLNKKGLPTDLGSYAIGEDVVGKHCDEKTSDETKACSSENNETGKE
ncbi:MAG: AI-2E family transporter [Eubacteriales bacterium]|nr:AI-2E family transporter [Eubacteriales bacterium]